MADCNPWPRLVLSEHSSLTNLRAWTLKHVRNSKGLNTHTQPRTHTNGNKASPPKSFNTTLTSSASDTSLSHVRCNRHSSSSQTPSPQIHTSPSFTFGSAHNTHTQRGGSKALGPVRGYSCPDVLGVVGRREFPIRPGRPNTQAAGKEGPRTSCPPSSTPGVSCSLGPAVSPSGGRSQPQTRPLLALTPPPLAAGRSQLP
ncbi:cytosolic carboxypeptidase-like protein 5 [Salvelinus sp. IW2-2015]|uniref:cytosolic carboxypeptidase-like protein 5 n=1 Tax=Salvelinus sp. IW2-2015 TaxID=2691554 RepID=UPI000CEABEF4|nr:cytosolic carboxypeptidase-like protein 5 [Salvelinus alpinus]